MRLLLALPLLTATAAAQQAVPTRTLSKPDVEFSEPFSMLVGLRELRDGRVVAADFREKSLQVVDLGAGRASTIGREGSGPGEFLMPMGLFSFPGDSTLLYDVGNTRFLVVGPDAKPGRTFTTVGVDPGSARGAPRGDGAGRGGDGGGRAGDAAARGGGRAAGGTPGGGGRALLGGARFEAPRAIDAQGRFYSLGPQFTLTEAGTVVSADSAPIHRLDPLTNKTDTVAYLLLPKNNVSGGASGSGGNTSVSIRIGGAGPFAAGNEWTATPDGRIVIAYASDYHIEIVQPGRQRVVGPPVRYTPVRVGDSEKDEWRTAQRTGNLGISMSVQNGVRTVSAAPPPQQIPEPESWPATKPPFPSGARGGAIVVAPNGEIWVTRTRAASDKVPTADVFDARGRLVGRVAFPPSTRLIGLGARGAYVVRIDADDLQYLQRHPITWTGCAPEIKEVCR
ncbi:MAG TPA: hypothetical protein VJR92_00550 [Gemmatimonadaceae bacterium]|nr:hypothetical protein [Gemmatimonadaceae bacterium]